MGLLFGDILAEQKSDLVTIWVGGALIFVSFKTNMEVFIRFNCKL